MALHRLLAITLALCASTAFADEPKPGHGVRWRTDYTAVCQESVKTGKPIFILFHRSYAPPTFNGVYERYVMDDPEAAYRLNEFFVPLQVDPDKDGPDRWLFKEMKQAATPAMLIAKPTREWVWWSDRTLTPDHALMYFRVHSPTIPKSLPAPKVPQ